MLTLIQISIHALLAESDPNKEKHTMKKAELFLSTLSLRRATAIATTATFNMPISIHALLAESDLESMDDIIKSKLFLSTLSLRRATGHTFSG